MSGRSIKQRAGQISILIIFSIIPMFTLFAFTVNIGMLVNAKIALQNAVDLAAYAGAAHQARLMTNMSHINYQMREVYKKFIFKYYVVGNISQKCFPSPSLSSHPECSDTDASSPKPFNWQNKSSKQAATGFPGVPFVCIALSKESNPCQLVSAVPVVQPPQCFAVDGACAALQSAAAGISSVQHQSCEKTSTINQEVLGNWLYATKFESSLQTNANLQGLVSDDIGMVTEELLNWERIKNLRDLINLKGYSGVTPSRLKQIEEGPDPTKAERVSLAYRTLANNLNSQVFDRDSIVMSELFGDNLLAIQAIQPQISTVFANMVTDASNPSSNCDMALNELKAHPYVGVYKLPQSHVHYLIKASAKARILFNPFPIGGSPADQIELSAYAAAMPFGSRIGPVLKEDDFIRRGTRKDASNSFKGVEMDYPALPMDDSHTTESSDVLAGLFNVLKDTGGSGGGMGGGTVAAQNLIRGMRAMIMPDTYEVGKYNIPVDTDQLNGNTPGRDFVWYYKNSLNSGNGADYTFWAPVVAYGGRDNFNDDLQSAVSELISNANVSAQNTTVGQNLSDLKNTLIGNLGTVQGQLAQRVAWNVFRMSDPMGTAFFKANGPTPSIPGKFTGGPSGLATSFVTDHDSAYFQNGRDGYSVKLIPIRSVISKPGKVSYSGSRWPVTNDLFGGDRGEMDKIAH